MPNPDFFARDFARIVKAFPVQFSWSGGTCTGVRSKASAEFVQSEAGVISGYQFSIRAEKSQFDNGTLPSAGAVVTVDGTEYRLLPPVELDCFGITVLLHLGAKAAGV